MSLSVLINILIFARNFADAADNFKDCLFSQEGTEYIGKIAHSRSGAECAFWIAANKSDEILHDLLFPDGSKNAAKNFCRNPSRSPYGPWCYLKSHPNLKKEMCNVPLCFSNVCRWTGPGEEYNGTTTTTAAGLECLPWSETNYYNYNQLYNYCKVSESNKTECRSCQNVDKSSAGPWCMVQKGSMQVKQLCHIPFCHLDPVLLLSGGTNMVTTFHKIPEISVAKSLKAQVRLWDPKAWLEGRVAMVLSVLNVPTGVNEIRSWGSALTVIFGNSRSAIIGSEVYDSIVSPGVLSATHWTNITINWERGSDNNVIVSVYINNGKKPLLITDIDTKSTLLQNADFRFVAIAGEWAFWNFPDFVCLVSTTSLGNKTIWQQLERETGLAEVRVFFRTAREGILHFMESPLEKDLIKLQIFLNGRIVIDILNGNSISRIWDGNVTSFDYWTWEDINVSILGDTFWAERRRKEKFEILFNVSSIASLRHVWWVAVSSTSVTHWAINCNPNDVDPVPKPEPPECSSVSESFAYNGTQYVAKSGKHCVPWIDNRIPGLYLNGKLFQRFGGRAQSMNYCRNLDYTASGPFCFVFRTKEKGETKVFLDKESCSVQECRMTDCKHAGTGSDYFGVLGVTRSHRICRESQTNDLVPLCRNPTQDVLGPWCFTRDPLVPRDLCLIQDCDRPATQTILLSTAKNNSYYYIMPRWRKEGLHFWIKNWNPSHDARVVITLFSSQASHFKLLFGGNDNEQVLLLFVDEVKETVLMNITTLHLLRSGRWSGLWLRFGLGYVELGREGIHLPFLQWNSGPSEEKLRLFPLYLNIGSQNSFWIGVSFHSLECLVETVWATTSHHLWPVDLWKDMDVKMQPNEDKFIEFFIQGNGTFSINFIKFLDESFISLVIADRKISLLRISENHKLHERELVSEELRDPPVKKLSWSRITIRYSDKHFKLETGSKQGFNYSARDFIFLFYWFYVETKSGQISWAVNCQPLEINGEPRAGGWSTWGPWECSKPCGGGEGRRKRVCDSPSPSIFGSDCVGPELYEGVCNNFVCGDVPPDFLKSIRRRLAKKAVSFMVSRGSSIVLPCNDDLASTLFEHVPNVKFEWSLNGFPYLTYNSSEKSFSLELMDVTNSLSGVWACSASWSVAGRNKVTIVGLAALVVTSVLPSAVVRESETLQLHCNAVALSVVYSDLSQLWLLNSSIWRSYPPNTISLVNNVTTETIAAVEQSHAGVWTCVVTHEMLGLQWTTAWIRVKVESPPNFWTYLIEDEATAPIFGSMDEKSVVIISFVGVLVCITLAIIFVVIYNTA